MDRISRSNGRPQEHSMANPPPPQPLSQNVNISISGNVRAEHEAIIRRFDILRSELDLLQTNALQASSRQYDFQDLTKKCNLYYDLTRSQDSLIVKLKDVSIKALRLTSDMYSTLTDESRSKFVEDMKQLQSAFDELAEQEKNSMPKLNTDHQHNPSTSDRFHPNDIHNGNMNRQDPRSIYRNKIPRSDVPQKRPGGPYLISDQAPPSSRNMAMDPAMVPSLPSNYESNTHGHISGPPHQSSQTPGPPMSGKHILNIPPPSSQNATTYNSPHFDQENSRHGPSRDLIHPSRHNLPPDAHIRPLEAPMSGSSGLQLMYTLPHGEVVCSIATSGQNANFVFTGGMGIVKLWDRSKNPNCAALSLESMDNYVRACRITPDGKTLVVGGESDKIILWDISQTPPASLSCFVTSSSAVYAITFSSDSRYMFSCCASGEIIVWDLKTQKRIKALSGHTLGVTCVDISPDSNKLVSGGLDRTIRVWDLTTYQQIACCTLTCPVFSLGLGCFSLNYSDSSAVIFAGLENSLISILPLVDIINDPLKLAEQHKTVPGHGTCVISIKVCPALDRFISTGKEGMIIGWRLDSNVHNITQAFATTENASVLACDISKDGKVLVTGSGNKYASVYSLRW